MIRRALYQSFSRIAEGKIRKLENDSRDPAAVQLEKLRSMLAANADTQFGRQHSFAKITSVDEYRAAVPVRDYEGFRPYIDNVTNGAQAVLTAEAPVMFATTSGTTGSPKFIPVTRSYMNEFRWASVISGYHLFRTYPGIAGGVALSVVSPAQEGVTPGGTPYGAISGQLFQSEPFLIKKFVSPIPYEVFCIKDYETKYYTLLRLALMLPLSFFYTLNPSTISLLCRRLKQHAGALIDDIAAGSINPPSRLPDSVLPAIKKFLVSNRRRAAELQALLAANEFVPHKVCPTLSLVSCWTKASASFYLGDFPEHFGPTPISDITYGASEGRGTVYLGPGKQALAVQSHYFEFIPEAEMGSANPVVLSVDELELDANYFILFTTSGGLYRYNINDVVKVVGFHNRLPLLEFQYKGGNVSSFTGEKVTELHVTAAVKKASETLGTPLRFFTAIPQFRPEPHYEIWLEPEGAAVPMHEFAHNIDRAMSEVNVEYKTKRDSQRLHHVQTKILAHGAYEKFRKHLTSQGVADAQIKVSHLNPKAEVREFLEQHLVTV